MVICCMAELHVLNDEYTRQWQLPMHINWRDSSSVAVNVLMNSYSSFTDDLPSQSIGKCKSHESFGTKLNVTKTKNDTIN